MLGTGLCGSFLNSRTLPSASQTCVGFPQPHELVLCCRAFALVCICFGSPAHSECHKACAHLFQLSLLALCIPGLVCTCLSSWGPLSALRGLCALASPQQAHPLCHGVCVFFFQLPGSALCDTRFAYSVPLSACRPALCTMGLLKASLGPLSPPSGWDHSL